MRQRNQSFEARFVAIQLKFGNKLCVYPTLGRVYLDKPNMIFWNLGGPTHGTFNTVETPIVKDYGVFYDDDDEAIDEIERQYYAEFLPKPAENLLLSEGWLSPEGVFYDCAYGEHTSLAHHITKSLYHSDQGEYLLCKTWVRIYESIAMWVLDGKPTTAQMNTLRQIVEANPQAPHLKEVFSDFCESHEE